MRVDDASFPCPPPAPSHTLFIILEAENLGRSSCLLFHIFSPPTLVGAHTDEFLLIGVGRRRVDSPPFRPGEESLDSKCILERWGGKAGTEGHTGSSKLVTPLSHGKGNEMTAPAPAHTDTGALCLLPPKKASGHSGTGFLQPEVDEEASRHHRKVLEGQFGLQSIMGNHHQDTISLSLSFERLYIA